MEASNLVVTFHQVQVVNLDYLTNVGIIVEIEVHDMFDDGVNQLDGEGTEMGFT